MESGDEHEHFDGVVSDHPSDEQSESNTSKEKSDDNTKKINKVKTKSY